MPNFATIIKNLRISRGITQEQLASLLKVSRSAIGMYETGSRQPDFETLEAFADIFNVDMDYLLGRSSVERKHPLSPIPSGFEPLPKMVKRPLVGDIACGEPITAEQNVQDMVDVPENVTCDFCLRCHGDSMIDAGIHDNDVVYIKIQPTVNDGEIAAVRIGDEATLKRVYYDGNTITLVPANSAYRPRSYSGPELNDIQIEGKAVGYTHWF